jgi:hypothetical protein
MPDTPCKAGVKKFKVKEEMKLSHPICRLLEETPPGTLVRQILMSGEDISGFDTFVKYDRVSGLAHFTNKSNSNSFVAAGERIDMIEFIIENETEIKTNEIKNKSIDENKTKNKTKQK